MNQILSMNGGMDTGKPVKMTMPTGSTKQPLDIKTTVLIFGIALIIFGFIIMLSGILEIVFSANKKVSDEFPKFEVSEIEGVLYITIQHNKPIEKVTYRWGQDFESNVEATFENNMIVPLELPAGDNILHLIVTDSDGNTKVFQRNFTGPELKDTSLPTIDLTQIESKLHIVAMSKSNTNMDYLTYRWNNEPEIRVNAEGSDKTNIEVDIIIPKGQNILTVRAVKANGVEHVYEKTIEGIVKPVIDIKKTSNSFDVIVKHDSGIKDIEIILNGRKRKLSEDQFGPNKKIIERSFLFEQQVNTIKITATSWDGAIETKEFQG